MADDEFFKRIAETAEPDDVVSDRPAGTAERRARRRAETRTELSCEGRGSRRIRREPLSALARPSRVGEWARRGREASMEPKRACGDLRRA